MPTLKSIQFEKKPEVQVLAGRCEVLMLLRATEIRHRYGDRITLDAVAFSLHSGDRVALTGRNGAGKTTLLRIILGQVRADSGELEVAPDTRIGALEQDPNFTPGLSVTQILRSSLHHVRSLEAKLRELEPNLADEAVALEWSRTLEAFERAGGYSAESRAMSAVHALALDDFLERETVTLSGGERTRLALACALCEEPDVMVLDEPTNHLDIAMREWLETRLREYPGALLIVSHDRALLDAVARETWHLERGTLTVYKGGYSKARAQRLEARRIQAKQSRLGWFEVGRLESAAKRVAQWGKNNDKLARRAKAIEARAERARGQVVEAPIRERKIAMSLEAGKARARVLVKAEHLSKHYGERVILEDAGIRIRVGDRIALLAPNGAGKTTMLRMLLGEIAPEAHTVDRTAPEAHTALEVGNETKLLEPEIRFSDGVQPAYFDQTYHGLSPNRAILEQLSERIGESASRALLGRYGFRPEDWPKIPTELSGGERARAGIALIAATRADLLVLDEPTNHLDVEVLELLEDAILAYPGSVLFVTHDRSFAKAVATRVLGIEHGNLIEFENGFEGYERARRGERNRLDPARIFEDELEKPGKRGLSLDQELQLLEENLVDLDVMFLRGGLTTREFVRQKREEARAQDRVFELYAIKYGAPLEFDFRAQVRALEVRCEAVGSSWRFWGKGGETCPALAGTLEDGLMKLVWVNPDGVAQMQAWYRKALLEGALRIAFEHLGAITIELPENTNLEKFHPLEVEAYAAWLGLKTAPKPAKKRLRFHPNFLDWARARMTRKRLLATNSEPN
jgi:ATPase subunit of ABC transporter with duplicated ATPase domains